MIWAILFAVFALIIGFFVAGDNVIVLILTTLIGAGIGYMVGMKAEKA